MEKLAPVPGTLLPGEGDSDTFAVRNGREPTPWREDLKEGLRVCREERSPALQSPSCSHPTPS